MAVSGKITRLPDEVGHLHGMLLIFCGDFFPSVKVILKLPLDQGGVVTRVDTKPKLGILQMKSGDRVHKLIMIL